MVPNLVNTLIALCLVCSAVLDAGVLQAHAWIPALSGGALVVLGFWANRIDYLKWVGVTALLGGAVIVLLIVSGLAAKSSETAFWIIFWSANAAGVVSLWSALYRGPDDQLEPISK
jgi:hypothetical protein